MDIPVIGFSGFQLENGLTVVVHEDHKAPIVAVSVWYRVGSAYEPPGKTGFAHLFEHLMFSGSENHRDEFFKPFELAGATNQNGTTWLDRTNYYETVPTTALDMALWMESDRMGHLLGAIGQAELDTQRGVVKNEKRQNENQPYGRAAGAIQLNAFPANHPYQHTTIGSMDDLDAATLDDVKQWFREYYGAANTTLVLAGDITPEQAREKARKYFADVPPGPPVAHPAPWTAARHASTRATQYDQVPQTLLIRQWNVPSLHDAELPLLVLAADVLGRGASSRLVQRLVHRDQLADDAGAQVTPFSVASDFSIHANVRAGVEPAAVEAAIADEWTRFLNEGPSEDELLRARTARQLELVDRLESVAGKAAVLAEGQVYRADPAAYRADFARLAAATPASVREAAQRWLARGDFTLVVAPAPAEGAVDETGAGLPAVDNRPAPVVAAGHDYKAVPTGLDRSTGVPRVEHFPELRFPEVQRATLRNGVEVVLAERHAVPLTHVLLQFDAGLAADQGRALGTSKMAVAMLDQGTRGLDATGIAVLQQRLGAQIHVGAGLDTSQISLSSLNATLDAALELLAEVARHPAYRDADLERQRGQWLAQIRQEIQSPEGPAGRLLPGLVYGDGHAYAMPRSGIGTERSLRGLAPADLVAFHRDYIRPDNMTIFVAGDTTLDMIMPVLERAFGDWRPPDTPAPRKHLPQVAGPSAPRVLLVHRAGASQSMITGAALAPPTSSPHYHAQSIANDVFGGTFTSRLNMNLREDKRWSYGVRSGMGDALGQRLLTVTTGVQTDKTAEAMQEILGELQRITGDQSPTAREIGKIRNQRVRTLPGRYESAVAVLQALAGNRRYGRRDDYALRLKHDLEAQDVETVGAAARELFAPGAFTWLVVGDLTSIEAPLRALDIGETSVIDADAAESRQAPAAPARRRRAGPQASAALSADRDAKGRIHATLVLDVPEGLHAYGPHADNGLPLALTVGKGFSLVEDLAIQGAAAMHLSGVVEATFVAQGQADELAVALRVQLCDDVTCLPPKTLRLHCPIAAAA